MMKLLLSLLLLLQANRPGPPTGTITGVVRNNAGTPAVGVRVYAMALSDGKDGLTPGTVMESLSQTDETGRYRLEVPAGRYYIAAGSVDSPTYFPGTSDVSRAQVISITSAVAIENIDFSSYIPPSPGRGRGFQIAGRGGLRGQIPTGVLSGVIRYPDGSPAGSVAVALTPSSLVNFAQQMTPPSQNNPRLAAELARAMANLRNFGSSAARSVQTDRNGAYRFDGLPIDTYYIAAGFADSPTFYPGVADLSAARTVSTTTGTNTADFIVPLPSKGTTVRGTIVAAENKPAANATVYLRSNVPPGLTTLLPDRPRQQATSKPDGSFELAGVLPGNYSVEVALPGTNSMVRSIAVGSQPVDGLQFSFPIATLFGEVLWEDGSLFSEVQTFRQVAVTNLRNPRNAQTIVLSLDNNGKFSRVIEFGEYRFFVPVLTDSYTVKSITSGSTDLLRETLKITSTSPVRVEVRLSKTR